MRRSTSSGTELRWRTAVLPHVTLRLLLFAFVRTWGPRFAVIDLSLKRLLPFTLGSSPTTTGRPRFSRVDSVSGLRRSSRNWRSAFPGISWDVGSGDRYISLTKGLHWFRIPCISGVKRAGIKGRRSPRRLRPDFRLLFWNIPDLVETRFIVWARLSWRALISIPLRSLRRRGGSF